MKLSPRFYLLAVAVLLTACVGLLLHAAWAESAQGAWLWADLLGAFCLAGVLTWAPKRVQAAAGLDSLARTARAHLEGDRKARFAEDGLPELAGIGRLLNAVVGELEARNADLRRSEARFKVISEYSHDALTAIAPPLWRFVSVNQAAVDLFGVPDKAALLAMTPGDVSPETQPDGTPTADAARKVIEQAVREGSAAFDWTHRSMAGEDIPCRVLLVSFELDGQLMVQGTVRDMRQARAAEGRERALQAQVQQAQKLEAVGRLAGGVAHDFNNMLAVITLQAEKAQAGLQDGLAPAEELEQIRRVAERSAGLVRQLLAFSRRQNAAPRAISLDEAVAASLKLLRPGLGDGIRLDWRPGAGRWTVRLDPVQVDQMLANLCSNARDACQGQGHVVISTDEAQLDEAACAGMEGMAPGPHVVLRVEDDGPGLSEAALAHVFEPFFTTKEVGSGTGLGLASVYGIVRQAGGGARVESRPGQGARFILYFPRHAGLAGSERPAAPAAEARPPRARILLVEDQDDLRRLFTEALARDGYDVLSASEPVQALDLAARPGERFDLLLSDVVMPGMNGLRLAQELRKLQPAMRELFMSGYSSDAMEEQGLETAGLHILAKPFGLAELRNAIRTTLAGAR